MACYRDPFMCESKVLRKMYWLVIEEVVWRIRTKEEVKELPKNKN
jgi:hypothetical protein